MSVTAQHYGSEVMETTPVLPLARPVVDAHCHMDVAFDHDHNVLSTADALAAAAAVGVSHVIQVGCDVPSSVWAEQAARTFDNVWAAVALHPNDAARDQNLEDSLDAIRELARSPFVRAIGETGLDYYRTRKEDAAPQHVSFRAHIDISKELHKPLVIHDRDAHADVIDTLISYGAPDTVVFHCYSGDEQMARICADHGWYMSFAGTVTFNNAQNLRDAVAIAPEELLLVETDAPFLTPSPFRGQPNSSALMPLTVRAMAQVRGVDEAEFCNALFSNAARVFGPF